MNTIAAKYQQCMDECIACGVECRQCFTACLSETDVKMLTHCIKLNDDCAAICFFATHAMAGASEFAEAICKLCATICTACAVECEKHKHMQHCAICAEQCRKCASACNNMVKN